MALFEPRKADTAAQESSKRTRATRRAVDSVDDMRRRARHRLIGACLLVLAAIVVFPMLFDTAPRTLPVNAQVSVTGQETAPALNVPTQVAMNGHGLADDEEVIDTAAMPAPSTPAAAAANPSPTIVTTPAAPPTRAAAAATQRPAEVTSLAAQRAQEARTQAQRAQAEPAKPPAKPATPPATTTTAANTTSATNTTTAATTAAKPPATPAKPAEVKPAETKPATTSTTVAAATPPAAVPPPPPPAAKPPAARTPTSAEEAARAKALLEGRPVETPQAASRSDEGRFIVQIGAFSDEAKVREIRQKLEGAGLKTYTQVVQTGAGRATRVRVGPFANRAEADRAAERVKAVSLPAAIMSM